MEITVAGAAENATTTYFVTDYWKGGNLSSYDATLNVWYSDAEKLAKGYGADGDLCWAAAACNIMQAQGWNRNFANEDRSLDYFMNVWPLWGGYPGVAISWWITGKDKISKKNVEQTPPGGAFYTLSPSAVLYKSNEDAKNNYAIITYFSDENLESTEEQKKGDLFFSQICSALESGYCLSLSIAGKTISHAITCWGYEISGDKRYLFITDSDDSRSATVDRRSSPDILHKYQVVIDKEGYLTFTEEYDKEICRISDFIGLAAYDPVYEGISETVKNAELLSLASNKEGKADTYFYGTIALAEDRDYYVFNSPVNGTVTVNLSAAKSGGTCRLKFSVLDEQGNVLQTTTTDKSSAITINVSESKYYILVESNGQAITMLDAPYYLSLSVDAGTKPDLVFANIQNNDEKEVLKDRFIVTSRDITKSDVASHVRTCVTIGNKPDYYADETLYAFCIVGNDGAVAGSYLVQAFVDGNLVSTVNVSGTTSTTPYLCTLALGKLSAEDHEVTIKVNMENSIPEMRYANNIYTGTISVKKAKNHTCGSDFNGNSIADITLVYQNGTIGVWTDADSAKWQKTGVLDLSSWSVAGSGDFKGDKKDDLLLIQEENGVIGFWNDGDSSQWNAVGVAGAGWSVLGVVDANQNGGRNDIVLMNDDYIYAWLDGSSKKGMLISSKGDKPQFWEDAMYAASGDVDGDGKDELLFQSTKENKVLILSADGENNASFQKTGKGSLLMAAGDFNHDEFDDLLFSTTTEAGEKICVYDSWNNEETTLTILSDDWKILGARDYNNDSYCDVLLENTKTGVAGYWHGTASGVNVDKFTVVGGGLNSDWEVIC